MRTGALPDTSARLLESLQCREEPVGVQQLAEELEVHPNTVREGLDLLRERGLVERHRRASPGRGRPAWVYQADGTLREPDRRVREHGALAGALAAHLSATSPQPGSEGRAAGRRWGVALAAGRTGPAREVVLDVLEELDFSPSVTGHDILLRTCPLLDVARAHPDVVCAVHEGMVQGVLEELGAPDDVRLSPFAHPAGCLLRIQSRRG